MSFNLNIQNVLNNTTHSGTGRMVPRGGTVPHQLSGAGSYANLELDDASGAVLDQGNLLVNGTLNLTSGILVSGTNRVVIRSGGTVGRVAGHVPGRLQKTIAAGPTARTFEIGDGMSYTPIAVTFGNVTSTGTLTAFTVPSDSPQLAAAGIVTARSVNRSWNLSASGLLSTPIRPRSLCSCPT